MTPQTELLHEALGWQEMGLGDVILCEVLQGYQRQEDYDSVRWALLELPVYTVGGTEIALRGAENYRVLRRRGCKRHNSFLACASKSLRIWEVQ